MSEMNEEEEYTFEALLEGAAHDGVIVCPKCGNGLEPDCEECGDCGWINPLVQMGFI